MGGECVAQTVGRETWIQRCDAEVPLQELPHHLPREGRAAARDEELRARTRAREQRRAADALVLDEAGACDAAERDDAFATAFADDADAVRIEIDVRGTQVHQLR